MPVARRIEIGGVSCFASRQAGQAYWLVPTGIGPQAANAAATAILSRQPAAAAISVGFAGALMPAAAIGDVIVATTVVGGNFSSTWTPSGIPMGCDESILRAVSAAAAGIGLPVRSGPVISLASVLCRSVDKQSISRLAGSIALDMESAAIGKVAMGHGVPFAVVRTVSDVAEEDLPLDFNAFLRPWGWIRGMVALIMAPSTLIALNRLRRHIQLAATRLTAVCVACAENGFGLLQPTQTGKAS
jgi:adenosylhomocysteine nucleosidase